ncbi:hypothetical protein BSCG_00550 [Bacteroides sp. 2_2_4]|uniref:Uncharacterized protein n=1 Tax=Bacteroides ovatus (strain ATCC 8483 / DSM 1896 / JCM 5824 / BCRC 10623 / CCUG 4943 / NCTC 11153) TaxID=411476 RepID=A0AAN3D815_BACO1|nr:hypothetical protein BACOVA_04464 [Bacteroides ovatus ATCC 8483]EEO53625.1 hypothetical protein BSCG_00550 [Bacteroides sp. 2_2_4]EEZ01909.1 hypothetical protein HMPREF0102_04317 [Bacteroides sp. 2_1_22]
MKDNSAPKMKKIDYFITICIYCLFSVFWYLSEVFR